MKKLIALMLVLTLLLSACAVGTTDTDQKPTDNTQPVDASKDDASDTTQTGARTVAKDQTYKETYAAEMTTLNYLVDTTWNVYRIAANMLDTLVDYDEYGVVEPCLATEWSTSEDGLTWTFKLREGVKWVDSKGKEYATVKAQDFVDSAKYILTPENASKSASMLFSVIKNSEEYFNGEITDFAEVGVKAVDEYVLEYTLAKPTSYFLSMLTYVSFLPVNGDFLAEVGTDFGTDNETVLYNGAYIMETYQPEDKRVLVKNQNYWDKDNVYIEKLSFKYNKETEALGAEMYQRGEISYYEIPTSSIDDWMKDPVRKNMIRPDRTTAYTYFYALNFDPQFAPEYEPENWKIAVNNLNFRKSLFHALDRTAALMTTDPYNPEALKLNTVTPTNFVDFEGLDYTMMGGLDKFTNTDSFDEGLAKEFRDKAMAELKGKATFPVKVLLPYRTDMSDWANRSQVLEQQMEKLLGADYIDIVLSAEAPTDFLKNVRRSGKYSVLECNWGPDYADPETYTDPFLPSASYNFPNLAEGYQEANGKNTYENMVDKAKEEVLDIEKRYQLFAEAEAFFLDQAFIIPYRVGGGIYVASNLDPFESKYAAFGIARDRFKGQKIYDKPVTAEEFKEGMIKWQAERVEALKNANK